MGVPGLLRRPPPPPPPPRPSPLPSRSPRASLREASSLSSRRGDDTSTRRGLSGRRGVDHVRRAEELPSTDDDAVVGSSCDLLTPFSTSRLCMSGRHRVDDVRRAEELPATDGDAVVGSSCELLLLLTTNRLCPFAASFLATRF